MRLAGIVFQACSIDNSDISPFRITVQVSWERIFDTLPMVVVGQSPAATEDREKSSSSHDR